MTQDEREELLERLQAANAESVIEIERRQRQREDDPAGHARAEREHQQMEAERENKAAIYHAETAAIYHAGISNDEWAEPVRSDYVQKFGSDVVLYRRHEENAQTPSAADDATGLFDSNPPAEDELGEAIDKFAEAVENKLDALERENIELRAKLDTLFQLLGTDNARKKLWTP